MKPHGSPVSFVRDDGQELIYPLQEVIEEQSLQNTGRYADYFPRTLNGGVAIRRETGEH
jgi:hypothetical protein